MNKTKKPESKLHKILRISGLSILTLIAIGITSYITVIRPLQIRQEKKNFTAAQASIDQLFSQIEAKIGKPDQIKKEGYCRYISQEFGRGPRSCSVNIRAQYESRDMNQANSLMAGAASLFKSSLYDYGTNSRGEPSLFVEPDLKHRGDQKFSQSLDDINGLSCGIQYLYPVTQDPVDPNTQKFNQVLTLEIYCAGSAKSEHFPVKNN